MVSSTWMVVSSLVFKFLMVKEVVSCVGRSPSNRVPDNNVTSSGRTFWGKSNENKSQPPTPARLSLLLLKKPFLPSKLTNKPTSSFSELMGYPMFLGSSQSLLRNLLMKMSNPPTPGCPLDEKYKVCESAWMNGDFSSCAVLMFPPKFIGALQVPSAKRSHL